jgi:hypothetical protein
MSNKKKPRNPELANAPRGVKKQNSRKGRESIRHIDNFLGNAVRDIERLSTDYQRDPRNFPDFRGRGA